jgi:hypothetical protein
VHHGRFGSPRVAGEKQGRPKGHIKRTWHCIHRHKRDPFGRCRSNPRDAAERFTLARSFVTRILD